MRKLASIQKIKEIAPIEDADKIELVKILGWQCIAKKGEFKPGDLCIYFEIDSFLPIREEYGFLRASSYKKSELLGEGYKLKTQKMRGQISQGLCLKLDNVFAYNDIGQKQPLSKILFDKNSAVFHAFTDDYEYKLLDDNYRHLEEGDDVTELLGVRKWEIPETASTGGTIIGQLPWFIPHSDETRIQNIPDIISEFENKEYYITTKMDGSSHAIGLDENDEFYVCGHNYRYKDDGKSSFFEYAKNKGFEKKLKSYKHSHGWGTVALIGEFCGAGIQKNRLKLQKPEWFVFTVNADGKRLGYDDSIKVAHAINARFVPCEEIAFNLPERYPDMDTLLERAEGQYPNGGQKEGIVIRTTGPVFSQALSGPLSFKVINNKYLLKNQD